MFPFENCKYIKIYNSSNKKCVQPTCFFVFVSTNAGSDQIRAAQLLNTGPRESVMKKEAEYIGQTEQHTEHTEQRLGRRST